MIVFSCFLQNMLMDGVINAFGVIYLEVTESFGANASQAAWILSIQTCTHGLVGKLCHYYYVLSMLYLVCCMWNVVCCMWWWCVLCCMLYVVYCILYVVCCMLMLYVVGCMLYVVRCVLYVVCCMLYGSVLCCIILY